MSSSSIGTRLFPASLASRCAVPIRKVVSTPNGDKHFGTGTGFHYRDQSGNSWLVTNWHVLTGRRPDDPGFLLSGAPQSPYRIEVVYPASPVGTFLQPVSLNIYEEGRPIWKERLLEKGVDIAAIPFSPPEGASIPFVQEFASYDIVPMRPGIDVVIIGFPFEQSVDMPFPIWKKAMISSEPNYTVFGQLQVLVDTPGMPGMSGSPVFTLSSGIEVTKKQYDAIKSLNRGIGSAVEVLSDFGEVSGEPVPCLTFAGIYAGATGKGMAGLEKLALGRIMLAPMVETVIRDGQPGSNPFPPEMYTTY